MSTLDRVLDQLQRRCERRRKDLAAVEQKVVAERRAGRQLSNELSSSYNYAVARYDESRLAYNAALRIDTATRRRVGA